MVTPFGISCFDEGIARGRDGKKKDLSPDKDMWYTSTTYIGTVAIVVMSTHGG